MQTLFLNNNRTSPPRLKEFEEYARYFPQLLNARVPYSPVNPRVRLKILATVPVQSVQGRRMSTSSIFGIRPTESRSSATAAVSPKPKETTGGAAITTEGTLDAELEYTPQRRSTAATLADIVNIYPVMVAIVPGLHRYDLLSLSLVSKEIHEILGQSTSNKYWKHLWSKCRRLKCEARPKASCSDAQHCVACRKGMCQVGYYRADHDNSC